MIEKARKTKEIASAKEEFHFPGSGEWLPMTVVASSQQEAEEIWLKTRKSSAEKVEHINQEDNQ